MHQTAQLAGRVGSATATGGEDRVASSSGCSSARSVEVERCSRSRFEELYAVLTVSPRDSSHAATVFKGSYSVVKQAVSRRTGQKCAVKVIQFASEGYNPEEIELLRLTDHPNIVKLIEAYHVEDEIVLVMPYVDGGELFPLASTPSQPLPEAAAARYVFQLLDALAYLHANGVVHRDVKLENVMLACRGDRIQLIDFGFSKRPGVGQRSLTSCCGSPHYMSPEMLKASRNTVATGLPTKHRTYGPEVDVWAAGVAMFVLLCGEYPFHDERHSQWHKKILEGRFAIPSWRAETLSEAGLSLIARLLDVNVATRLTAAEALHHPWFAMHGLEAIRDAACFTAGPMNPVLGCPPARKAANGGTQLRVLSVATLEDAHQSTAIRATDTEQFAAAGHGVGVDFTPPRNKHRLTDLNGSF